MKQMSKVHAADHVRQCSTKSEEETSAFGQKCMTHLLGVAGDAKPALARAAARRVGFSRGGTATAAAGSGGGAESAGGWFWQFSHLHRLPHGAPAYKQQQRQLL